MNLIKRKKSFELMFLQSIDNLEVMLLEKKYDIKLPYFFSLFCKIFNIDKGLENFVNDGSLAILYEIPLKTIPSSELLAGRYQFYQKFCKLDFMIKYYVLNEDEDWSDMGFLYLTGSSDEGGYFFLVIDENKANAYSQFSKGTSDYSNDNIVYSFHGEGNYEKVADNIFDFFENINLFKIEE